jgi:hypothetical protein
MYPRNTDDSSKKKLVLCFKLSRYDLRRRAMNMPGMTMSPSPSMAKLEAFRPFSSRS